MLTGLHQWLTSKTSTQQMQPVMFSVFVCKRLYARTCTCIMLLSSYVAYGASSESLVMGIGWLSIYQKQTALAVLSSIICIQLQ